VIQAHKSIDHAAASVRDGGVVVVAAECAAGIGSDTFLPWFGLGDARAVSRRLLAQYELNGHTALALIQKLERLKIILVSSLDRSLVERMGMILARSLDEAVSLAGAYVGKKPLTYILPMAWGILPVAEG
jgi:nickel-dependent lactate racemase